MNYFRTLLSVTAISIITLQAIPTPRVQAVTAAEWKAGRIIDDSIFTNANDMSVVDIQNFLNTKVPSCDTNGTRPASEYGRPDLTHAQYAAMKGWAAPPYICLRDYYEVPKTSPGPGIPANNYTGTIPAGAISAAQMIYDAAQQYRINAKVLLVKLGTESHGPLTSDSWPLQWQYTFAMGAHCPDSGPGGSANCDTNYAGFSIQMREAASLLRWYLDGMTQSWWQYRKPYQVNSILWKQSTTGCGAGDVYIESKATAALYTYTPYQPNQAALNNMYGLGDGCSSYGNRNFWRVYSDWFGSTSLPNGTIRLTGDYSTSVGRQAYAGENITVQYTVANDAPYPIFVGGLGVCARNNGLNNDFGFDNSVTIPANSTVTITKSRVIDHPGILKIFICSYNASMGGWTSEFYPYNYNGSPRGSTTEIVINPSVSTGLTLSPTSPSLGQPVTATFTVQNMSNTAVTIPVIGVAVRDPAGTNVGFPGDTDVTIAPNSTYTFSKTRTFTGQSGTYKFWITSFRNNVWDDGYPRSINGAVKSLSQKVFENPNVSTGLTLSPTSPSLGQPVTATFTVQNMSNTAVTIPVIGVAVRDPAGTNVGFPGDTDVTIAPNSTYTFSKTRTFTGQSGTYKFWITSFRNNVWDDGYPVSLGGAERSLSVSVVP